MSFNTLKCIDNANFSLSFKEIAHEYFLKRLMVHNKFLCVSLLIAYQLHLYPNIVFKWRINFSSFKFSSNCLWSSSASCWFDITPLQLHFLSKNVCTIEANPLWWPSYFGLLAIAKALDPKTLSGCVLSIKFFYLL